jgi:hypothetical protein
MTSHPSPLVVFLLLVLVGGTGQAQSVGAAGIPLGSTALGVQGLSPLGATTGPGSPSSGSAACPSRWRRNCRRWFARLHGDRRLTARRIGCYGCRNRCAAAGWHGHSLGIR